MAILSVEELYNQYIKPLPPAEKLRLVELTAHDLGKMSAGFQTEARRSLLELEGLGAEIWQGVDAQAYVNELREEWEHRPYCRETPPTSL